MYSWGKELWDSYSVVLSHVNKGADEMTNFLAKLVKEKGDIEREYAKDMRKLVKKFELKLEAKQGPETSQKSSLK